MVNEFYESGGLPQGQVEMLFNMLMGGQSIFELSERLSVIVNSISGDYGEISNFICITGSEYAHAGWNRDAAQLNLSTGLLLALNDAELKAVIGHELMHNKITNEKRGIAYNYRNLCIATNVAIVVGSVGNLLGFKNNVTLFAMASFAAATFADIFYVNHGRHKVEFACDEAGANESSPKDMRNALKKIQDWNNKLIACESRSWVHKVGRNIGGAFGSVYAAIRDEYDPCAEDKPAQVVIADARLSGGVAVNKLVSGYQGATSLFRSHPSDTNRLFKLWLRELKEKPEIMR